MDDQARILIAVTLSFAILIGMWLSALAATGLVSP